MERTQLKLECSYMVSGMMERGWGKVSFPKGGKCSILNINKTQYFCPKFTLITN